MSFLLTGNVVIVQKGHCWMDTIFLPDRLMSLYPVLLSLIPGVLRDMLCDRRAVFMKFLSCRSLAFV